MRAVDVIILGGGPAGTSAALGLARVGWSVLLLERSRSGAKRPGETLPPEVIFPLSELGLWNSFLNDGPCPSPGIVSFWGASTPSDNDFILNPLGPGWHIDRRRFDAMLSLAAKSGGAESLLHTRLTSWHRDSSGVWFLNGNAEGHRIDFQARVLIDATGRTSSCLHPLGGGRLIHDRLVGLVGFVQAAGGVDLRTLVEAVPIGWWYSSPLPAELYIAAFMTDADLIPRGRVSQTTFWADQLSGAPQTRARLGHAVEKTLVRVVGAHCSRMVIISGDGWLSAGDAASALDPLSGQGVYRALVSGLAAARAAGDYLQGNKEALNDYARQVSADFAADLKAGAAYYAQERRWPSSPFWRRRHAAAEPSARFTSTLSI